MSSSYLTVPNPWAPANPQPLLIQPDCNPAGSFHTTFDLPAAWNVRRVFLRVDGARADGCDSVRAGHSSNDPTWYGPV